MSGSLMENKKCRRDNDRSQRAANAKSYEVLHLMRAVVADSGLARKQTTLNHIRIHSRPPSKTIRNCQRNDHKNAQTQSTGPAQRSSANRNQSIEIRRAEKYSPLSEHYERSSIARPFGRLFAELPDYGNMAKSTKNKTKTHSHSLGCHIAAIVNIQEFSKRIELLS